MRHGRRKPATLGTHPRRRGLSRPTRARSPAALRSTYEPTSYPDPRIPDADPEMLASRRPVFSPETALPSLEAGPITTLAPAPCHIGAEHHTLRSTSRVTGHSNSLGRQTWVGRSLAGLAPAGLPSGTVD